MKTSSKILKYITGMTYDKFAQIMACVGGLTSAYLVNLPIDNEYQKFACIIGFAASPFWYFTTIKNKQWPLLVMSFYYSFAWFMGIYNNFIGG